MKILVLQEYGQAGQLLLERLEQTSLQITPVMVSKIDDLSLDKVESWLPEGMDLLVNTVALDDPQWAEAHPESCRHRLVELPRVLADFCKKHGMAMLQLSSCYIFDGRKHQPYITSNPGHPLSMLGQCQWETEQYLRANLSKHLILRTGWSLRRFVRLMTRAEERLLLSSRYQGQAVATMDQARVLTAILQQLDCDSESWGTFQYAGSEEVTMYELGQAILDILKLDAPPMLVDDAEPWSRLEPENAVMGCLKIRNTFGIKQLSWRHAVEQEYDLLRREQAERQRERTALN
ncbi:SDR family oxidoreductase [Hydrocarboniclastica marina]|uniref:dTDP-4-dehydrorhamnose reductase n=1 Tax=Hydrocarboniclastica marina TaxID=2259620 RepID=A0A4P7XHC5_9ALTE|nr:sugar nucleotide-binding protein [Hydrocarboniclastica marina]QCF25197.1 NAD-dependent epimerase/dehydratase family protein [Hydrocarboniclastica marina]